MKPSEDEFWLNIPIHTAARPSDSRKSEKEYKEFEPFFLAIVPFSAESNVLFIPPKA